MNVYEKKYIENYEVRNGIIQKMRGISFQDSNGSASMESRIMFEKFKGSELREITIDIVKLNIVHMGQFMKNDFMQSYNQLILSGPNVLLHSFINQNPRERKINIFINSTQSHKNYNEPNHLLTSQYCNVYGYDYMNHYIVIVTSQRLYAMYRELYPHFLICIQPDTHITSLGLTRYCSLSIGYHLRLERIAIMDDDIMGFVYSPITSTAGHSPRINLFSVIKKLSKMDITDDVAAIYPTDHFIENKDILSIDESIKLRKVIPHLVDINDANSVDRFNTKFSVINCQIIQHHNINYHPGLNTCVDVNLIRSIFLKKLNAALVNIKYTTIPIDNAEYDTNRFLCQKSIETMENAFYCETEADNIMYYGRLLCLDDSGIYGMPGVYGPYRLLMCEDIDKIKSQLSDKYDIKHYIMKGYIDKHKKLASWYIRPNGFHFVLPNLTQTERTENAIGYVECDNKNARTQEYDLHDFKENYVNMFDLVDVNEDVIYKTFGTKEHLRQYEYLDNCIHASFRQMTRDNHFTNFIGSIFKRIMKEETNIKYLMMDDIYTYLSRYDIDPNGVHKLLALTVLYIRYNRLLTIISARNYLSKLQFEQFIMMLGGYHSPLFNKYDIDGSIENIISYLLDNFSTEQSGIGFDRIKIGIVKEKYSKIFGKVMQDSYHISRISDMRYGSGNSVQDIAFVNHLMNIYKCTHLRSSLTSYVPTKKIIEMIEKHAWEFDGQMIKINDSNKSAHPINPNVLDSQKTKLIMAIESAWGSSYELADTKLETIFKCINTPVMYREYLRLVEETMDIEHIDHIELRHCLGNVDGWEIIDELRALGEFRKELGIKSKSIMIIPQYDGKQVNGAIMDYFGAIRKAIDKLTDLGKVDYIKGFDILDMDGIELRNIELGSITKLVGQMVPTMGSNPSNLEIIRGLFGAYKCSHCRMGNGLNHSTWNTLPRDTVFEYCPVSYVARNIKINTHTLNQARPIIVVSADKCNKLGDKHLGHNFVQLWQSGVNYFKLQISLLYSIIASFTSDQIKNKMLDKWHNQYCQYYGYINENSQGNIYYYAVDRDCKWFISTHNPKQIMKLESITRTFMDRSLLSASKNETVDGICRKIAYGMELYAYKPSLTHDVTWSTEEYNLPEFQYTYIRLKSLQRYTECYTMYEQVFFGVNLNSIKSVLSIGGGCGFELIALRDYFTQNGSSPPQVAIIDVAEAWKVYGDLIGVTEYIITDVNEMSPDSRATQAIRECDLLIFSYVFKYLKETFFTALNVDFANKLLIFNERRAKVADKVRQAMRITDDIYVRGIKPTNRTFIPTFKTQ